MDVDTKVCTGCGEEKPLVDFHRNSHSKDGFRSRCKACHSTEVRFANLTACPGCGGGKHKKSKFCVGCNSKSPGSVSSLSDVQAAWLAGILEGEGSWVSKRDGRFYVMASMTDLDVLEEIRSITNVGTVISLKSREEHWKQAWRWTCARQEQCKDITVAVWPYLKERRKQKILALWPDAPVDRGTVRPW